MKGGIMAFIPIEYLRYKVNLSKEEIINCLNTCVEPKNMFHWFGKPYFGEISENGFKIIRHSVMKNCFRPVIIGNMVHKDSCIYLEILMRPYLCVIPFMCLLLGSIEILFPVFCAVSIGVEMKSIMYGFISFVITFILTTVISGILYTIMVFFFKIESKQVKLLFNEWFKTGVFEEENNIKRLIMYIMKGAKK